MPRWDLAERVQEWVHPVALTKTGKIARCLVPGHGGRQYTVSLEREAGTIRVQCVQANDQTPCKGNHHSLCYHALGSVLYAIRTQGLTAQVYGTREEAEGGGAVIRVASSQGPGEAFLSVGKLTDDSA